MSGLGSKLLDSGSGYKHVSMRRRRRLLCLLVYGDFCGCCSGVLHADHADERETCSGRQIRKDGHTRAAKLNGVL